MANILGDDSGVDVELDFEDAGEPKVLKDSEPSLPVVFGRADKDSDSKITIKPVSGGDGFFKAIDLKASGKFPARPKDSQTRPVKAEFTLGKQPVEFIDLLEIPVNPIPDLSENFALMSKFQYFVITSINNRELKRSMAVLDPNVFFMAIPAIDKAKKSLEMNIYAFDNEDTYDEHQELNLALHSLKGFKIKDNNNFSEIDGNNLVMALTYYLFDLVENSNPKNDFGVGIDFVRAAEIIEAINFSEPLRKEGKRQNFKHDNVVYTLDKLILDHFKEYLSTYFLLQAQGQK